MTQVLKQSSKRTQGYLTFTLHAHLPYVVNHGTWPHGMEWLHEAAAETYLPLLRVLSNLERDGIRFQCNLNLSPILLEQLCHPVFIAEFPKYLTRKIVAAREDEAFFIQSGDGHLAEMARFWYRFFQQALDDFHDLKGNIIARFRHFNDIGLIEVITCGATHGYLPLLGTDESVRAQIRTAVNTHTRHMGRHPRGIWAPECGYRPAGFWNYPVGFADGSPAPAGFDRIGVEQALSESDIEFFFVDTHLVERGQRVPSPYELLNGAVPTDEQMIAMTHSSHRSLYQPYYVDGPYDKRYATTIFPRDPRTGIQVWSGDSGYPGDGVYLDFHKKRWPGGHRYWRVTGPRVDLGDKQPYYPKEASERVKSHASHFVHLVYEALKSGFNDPIPPILCAPFDAELFGHWWFEGGMWLEAIARTLHDYDTGIEMTSCSEYLDRYPRAGFIALPGGSWGAGGGNEVWLNPETTWTYTHIYPAEMFTREIASSDLWRSSELGARIARQLCRELLLLESSDWQFLVTTGAARDYAEARFTSHNDQFNEVKSFWKTFEDSGELALAQETRLEEIERRDSVFPDIDPGLWAAGAKEENHQRPPETTRPHIPADGLHPLERTEPVA
ncbi:glycoside hydrolase family 57 protein [Edaphobacter modestus]|uniref:1,4-alpha-glucan branching enzyme n=1 Tax=Edaphobacter modestus TaxID=388466 RepID=A0A4Q7YUD7_9BACT|nr:1,4-alpha-glucan branching protein domain-containing protein [Edaphobacter modestus]RZU40575.1 1,4-alpha-glucan branching enzyme [Edaphobacter modestus]